MADKKQAGQRNICEDPDEAPEENEDSDDGLKPDDVEFEGGSETSDSLDGLSGEEDSQDSEFDAADTAALLEEIAKDPPKADEVWKKNVPKMDELLKKRHGNCVKLSWHPVKGRVLLSRRKFNTGDMILTDRALITVPAPAANEVNDLWYSLLAVCKERGLPLDPVWYWTALTAACPPAGVTSPKHSPCPSPTKLGKSPVQHEMGSSEAEGCQWKSEDSDIERAIGQEWLVPPSEAVTKRLSMLFRPEVTEPSLEVLVLLHDLKLKDSINPLRVEEMLQTAIQNCFQCSDEQERNNLGMWFTPSLLSHSCIPNASGVVDSTGTFTLVAQRIIRPGEELTISYISEDDLKYNTAYRRTVLAKSRRFVCQCPRCEGADAIRPATCLVCGQILLYMDTGEEIRKQGFCRRLCTQGVINTYVWSHMFFCALSGGNI